jgi:cation-transporting ATPase 13A3/4/5
VYATAIFILAVTGALVNLIETRANLMRLKKMAKFICKVQRLDGTQITEVSSDELVPGDLVVLPDQFVLPCDMILMSGQCVVNESMLTGESVPVVKNALPTASNTIYSVEDHKMYTLFAGTSVVQTRTLGGSNVVALVCRTGYQTAKGKLVLSILYPKPNSFKFYTDSFYFIGIMFIGASIGFFISLRQLIILRVSVRDIILRALDVITICVPPALPIAMTFGTSFAISRMKEKEIYCISPPRVNVSGKIKVMCFDKTGTLTEESLDTYGVCPVQNANLQQTILEENIATELVTENMPFLQCMASCHGLSNVRGELVGDPLEIKMFHSTKWLLQEPEENAVNNFTIVRSPDSSFQLGIMRRFEFLPILQRMSAVIKDINTNKLYAFSKGSPEKLMALCNPESIPRHISSTLKFYTHKGCRVLALAMKELPSKTLENLDALKREEVESQLTFLGFVIMLNKLKGDTKKTIELFNSIKIRSVMVTGDNALTAISVAKACSIIPSDHKVYLAQLTTDVDTQIRQVSWVDIDTDTEVDPSIIMDSASISDDDRDFELACTGDVFDHLIQSHSESSRNPLIDRLLLHCQVFARMAPNHKMRVVEELIAIDYYVGMCGDGANDCAALKAAHVGISLSEAEASIAAPFTSRQQTIASVPIVIREGRAALATSYQLFKYMASYSFIQFLAVIILYHINSNLGDWQFLFVDLGLIFPTILFMGRTEANPELTKRKPSGSLISFPFLTSLLCQFLIALGFQLLVFFDVRSQSFYRFLALAHTAKENIFCYENAAVFLMNAFQTFSIALSYNISKPFKKPVYTNRIYSISLVLLFAVLTYLILYPDAFSRRTLQILVLPQSYRFRLYGFCLLHLVASYLFELIIIQGPGAIVFKICRIFKKTKKARKDS